jgi:hypothetical protein
MVILNEEEELEKAATLIIIFANANRTTAPWPNNATPNGKARGSCICPLTPTTWPWSNERRRYVQQRPYINVQVLKALDSSNYRDN